MDKLVNMLFVNWRTTLMGLLGAMTTSGAAFLSQQQTGAWPYLASLFMFLQGLFAKDSRVTGTPGTTPVASGSKTA